MFYWSRSAGTIPEKPPRLMNNRLWLYRPLYLWQFYRFYFRITRNLRPYACYIRDDALGCGNGLAFDDVITVTLSAVCQSLSVRT